jgi:hypothetical protein
VTIDDAYRTLGVALGAAQAEAFAAHQEQTSRLASAPEHVVAEMNRAYEMVTQDIWRRSQPAVEDVPSDDEDADAPTAPEPWEAVGQRPSSRRKVALLTVGLVVAALATVLVVAPMIGEDGEATTESDDGTVWTDEAKAQAVAGCNATSGGLAGPCRCIVEELTATMSPEEVIRVSRHLLDTGRVPQQLVPVINYCAANG